MTAHEYSIGLVTCAHLPNLAKDDQVLANELYQRKSPVRIVIWDAPDVDWSSFSLLVIRSCWDYHLKYDKFLEWLAALDALGVSVWNDTDVVRWNSDKSYLKDLESRGVPIVPTELIVRGRDNEIEKTLDRCRWPRVVVKPAVASTAYKLKRLEASQRPAIQRAIEEVLEHSDALIQPFIDAFESHGEFSFIFFDRVFSHAVFKRAAPGDFRVQDDFGGSVELATLSPQQISQAESALRAAPGNLHYARLDMIAFGDQLLVSEMELIEPELFFRFHPASCQRMAGAIIKAAKRS